jgi:drug/metabolite transporter (DMT)-like permease
MFGGALSWAAYTLIGQRALKHMSPLVATTWSVVVGALMLIAVATPRIPAWVAAAGYTEPSVWWAAAYLGVFGSVIAFIWYSQGVQQLGAARTAVFNNLVPVFAVLLSVLLLNESLHWSMVVGGAVVIAGVTLTTRVG